MTTKALVDPLNPLKSEFLADPYPTLARFRSEAPVFWSEKNKYWIVTRYREASAIFRDLNYEKQIQRWKQRPMIMGFLSAVPPFKSLANASRTWMLNLNPPDHTRVRSLVSKAFTPTTVQKLRPTIESIAEGLLDSLQERGSMELMHEFAFALPIAVIGHMLGVPMTERARLKHCSDNVAGVVGGQRHPLRLARAGKAIAELRSYFAPLIEERRKNPQDDLISVLVQAEEDNGRLSADEVANNCVLLLVAGHETTVNLIGNAVLCLLRYPDQMELLRRQPELVRAAVDEVLRFESPVQVAPRLAGRDLELGGQKLQKGDLVYMLLGSANRDEEQFENAGLFDITRPSGRNLAFGEGIHRCIGASLAEVEAQIAIDALLTRFKRITLVQEKVQFKTPFGLRGPEALSLAWK